MQKLEIVLTPEKNAQIHSLRAGKLGRKCARRGQRTQLRMMSCSCKIWSGGRDSFAAVGVTA
jgi:hypothetical protein